MCDSMNQHLRKAYPLLDEGLQLLHENYTSNQLWCLEQFRHYKNKEVLRTMVHGDLWTSNILWRDSDLAAIVDWATCHAGSLGADESYNKFVAMFQMICELLKSMSPLLKQGLALLHDNYTRNQKWFLDEVRYYENEGSYTKRVLVTCCSAEQRRRMTRPTNGILLRKNADENKGEEDGDAIHLQRFRGRLPSHIAVHLWPDDLRYRPLATNRRHSERWIKRRYTCTGNTSQTSQRDRGHGSGPQMATR
ncbi:hypothetical protein OSTOST_09974 [Ostertagia ostertagi]